jgi:hypothetical protein
MPYYDVFVAQHQQEANSLLMALRDMFDNDEMHSREIQEWLDNLKGDFTDLATQLLEHAFRAFIKKRNDQSFWIETKQVPSFVKGELNRCNILAPVKTAKFHEVLITGNQDSGYTALGLTRQQAASHLYEHHLDENYLRRAAPDVKRVMGEEISPDSFKRYISHYIEKKFPLEVPEGSYTGIIDILAKKMNVRLYVWVPCDDTTSIVLHSKAGLPDGCVQEKPIHLIWRGQLHFNRLASQDIADNDYFEGDSVPFAPLAIYTGI